MCHRPATWSNQPNPTWSSQPDPIRYLDGLGQIVLNIQVDFELSFLNPNLIWIGLNQDLNNLRLVFIPYIIYSSSFQILEKKILNYNYIIYFFLFFILKIYISLFFILIIILKFFLIYYLHFGTNIYKLTINRF